MDSGKQPESQREEQRTGDQTQPESQREEQRIGDQTQPEDTGRMKAFAVDTVSVGAKENAESGHDENDFDRVARSAIIDAGWHVRQAFIALNERRFEDADKICNKALMINPEYAQAYVGKLLAEYHLTTEEELKKSKPFDQSENYTRALKYANSALADMLTESAKAAKEANKRKKMLTFGILLAIAIFLFCVIAFIIIPNSRYESIIGKAETLLDAGKTDEAFALLKSIEENKTARMMMKTDPRMMYAVGQTIFYGRYEQDAVRENGVEPLEWMIVMRSDNNMLLLSKYALEFRPFQKYGDTVNWELSDVREWLNNDFLMTAFSDVEAEMILEVEIPVEPVDGKSGSGSESRTTTDKLLLLSLDEAEKYLMWNAKLANGEFTPQAVTSFYLMNGKQMKDVDDMPSWWTRTVKKNENGEYVAECICLTAVGYHHTEPVNSTEVAVRPAMWVHMSKERLE